MNHNRCPGAASRCRCAHRCGRLTAGRRNGFVDTAAIVRRLVGRDGHQSNRLEVGHLIADAVACAGAPLMLLLVQLALVDGGRLTNAGCGQ